MESFFLAETLKYLYLLFDPDNFLHNDGREGTVINTPNGECIIDAGGYVFNTEAHPIDPGALKCCHEVPRENPLESYDPDVVIGELVSERPRKKVIKKPKKVQKEPVIDHLEITIAELQQFLENAKKLSELEQKAIIRSQNISQHDDSLILPVEGQKKEHENLTENYNKSEEDLIPEILKEKLEKIREELQKADDIVNETVDNTNNKKYSSNSNTKTNLDKEERPVEVIKLSSTRDSDETETQGRLSNSSPETDADQNSPLNDSKNYTIIYKEKLVDTPILNIDDNETSKAIRNLINSTGVDDSIANNSVFQEFVQTIIKVTQTGRTPFDPQELLENIRTKGVYRNESWSKEYHLLTCRAQPFLQRLSILGQFFY